MTHVAILGAGMVTGVGLNAAAACAAFRAGISGLTETHFFDDLGEPLIGCRVPLNPPLRGRDKLVQLVGLAIRECLDIAVEFRPESIPLLLCIAERGRPGRLDGLDDRLLPELQRWLGVRFHPDSEVIPRGRVGGAIAIDLARKRIAQDSLPRCLIAGVDSFLVRRTLNVYQAQNRLLTKRNSNGFSPGEAGAAVLVGPSGMTKGDELRCLALGFGREKATVNSSNPLRADGLVEAFRGLFVDGGVTLDDAEYRFTDCNGEQYAFKQDRLAIARTVRKLKERFDHLHPADCFGEVGAAIGPCILGLALAAARKRYAPGRGVLCHFSDDDGERAAMLLSYQGEVEGR